MSRERWDEKRMPGADALWQLYHENSKATRYKRPLGERALGEWQSQLSPSLVYDGHPAIALPPPLTSFPKTLESTLRDRATAMALRRVTLSLEVVATLLHYSYGITRPLAEDAFPFGLRPVPSGGALYPLEIYFHAADVEGLPPGIYHYEPHAGLVRRFVDGDQTENLSKCLAQSALALDSSIIVFVTALFERTTTKYGERGYRFALIEAGHVVQNLALCTAALDLGGTPIGGFFDYPIDEMLQIDGIRQSTIYLFATGGKPAP
ncbi:MAG TPA: SagB/ThcOx family dehydrogenase [Candidatus Cybelea sp.]|jgi:SagB-type dehydrogenase family enzyme|nr:SagB/ThcOx family dehydrogenase [Candidatus Cybelea sp.]